MILLITLVICSMLINIIIGWATVAQKSSFKERIRILEAENQALRGKLLNVYGSMDSGSRPENPGRVPEDSGRWERTPSL